MNNIYIAQCSSDSCIHNKEVEVYEFSSQYLLEDWSGSTRVKGMKVNIDLNFHLCQSCLEYALKRMKNE